MPRRRRNMEVGKGPLLWYLWSRYRFVCRSPHQLAERMKLPQRTVLRLFSDESPRMRCSTIMELLEHIDASYEFDRLYPVESQMLNSPTARTASDSYEADNVLSAA